MSEELVTMTATLEASEAAQPEAKPKKSRSKKPKAVEQEQAAPAAPEAEAAQPVAEVPEVAQSPSVDEILEAIDSDLVEFKGTELDESLKQSGHTLNQAEPEQIRSDVVMRTFGKSGLGGANLFLGPEHKEVAQQMADAVGVELKTSAKDNPYLTVNFKDINKALEPALAAGLSVYDPREAQKESRIAKREEKESARFDAAGSFVMIAYQKMFETGRTFNEGKELSFYQTKFSMQEQAAIAEARAEGKPVKDKPIEMGVYDKRTGMVLAQGTIGRDKDGKVTVRATVDNVQKCNALRPDGQKLILPNRAQIVESIAQAVETRSQKPVLKAKEAASQGR